MVLLKETRRVLRKVFGNFMIKGGFQTGHYTHHGFLYSKISSVQYQLPMHNKSPVFSITGRMFFKKFTGNVARPTVYTSILPGTH